MTVLDRFRNAIQRPEGPAGNPAEFSKLREAEFKRLFLGDPVRVIPHEVFGKPPNMGGHIDVRIYQVDFARSVGQVEVVVTSGMSDYRMAKSRKGAACRRELVQYFREARTQDLARLHDMAWLPLASRFCLDFFETIGPHPVEYPGSLFIPSLVKPHADFKMTLGGDEMQLLWHVPLLQTELDLKLKHGVDPLLKLMEEKQLPWIFDAGSRTAMI